MNRSLAVFLATVAVLFVGITVVKWGRRSAGPATTAADSSSLSRERVLRFWDRYREATALRTAGRIREAAAAYEEALALDAHHEDALYYSGSMLFELGRLAEAETAWRRLIEVNDLSARAHSRLGDLYLCYDRARWFDPSAAEEQFRRAAEINREETGPLLRLGEIALVRGELDSARARLDEVLGSHSGSISAHFLQGYIAWKKGETAEAAARAARLEELTRDRDSENTGLNEGDTESGAAMVATVGQCRGIRDLLQSLDRGAASISEGDITTLYWRADTLLTDARREIR